MKSMLKIEFTNEEVKIDAVDLSVGKLVEEINDKKDYFEEVLQFTKDISPIEALVKLGSLEGRFEVEGGKYPTYVNSFSAEEFALMVGNLLMDDEYTELGMIIMSSIVKVVE